MIAIRGLEGASFRLPEAVVPAGELAAVVAPTRACALEFVDLTLGLMPSQRGAVELFGQELSDLDERSLLALRSRIGFAARTEGLVNHLSLRENIMLATEYHRGRDAEAVDARVRELLGWCGWPEEAARRAFLKRPESASPFEKAAAAWLRAVLSEPELLVCEDVFAGLKEDQRRHLIEASVAFLSEDPRRASVFVLVGEGMVEELQPTSMFYLSLRGDFRAESQA